MKDSIKKLREMTGFGISDCKKALVESKNDLDKALRLLREKGAKILEKRAAKKAKEGIVEAYVHFSQNLGTLVEVNCESDFVARNDDFKKFAKDISMHIAAMAPKYVERDQVSSQEVKALSKEEKEEFYKKHCLLDQAYVKDNAVTIGDYLKNLATKFKENIRISRFVRFSLGEDEA